MEKKRIQLLIFDLDGTLVDAYPAITASFNFTMRRLGLKAQSASAIRRAVGWGDRQLLAPFVPEAQAAEALDIYRKHHRQALRGKTRFLPGTKAFLAFLKKKNYALAIASNRPSEFTRIILDDLKLTDLFAVILCGDEVKRPKPAPDLLKEILKKLSLTPSQAVYIGDMTVDVLAGRRARIKTIAVSSGSHSRQDLKEARPWQMVKGLKFCRRILDDLG